jgi:plasmid stabilization system protein ParE
MARARRVVWAPRAKQDLLEIWRYYARVASPEIADDILREIERVAAGVGRNPLARRLREELGPGLRSALVSPHTIFYGFEVGRFRSCASCTSGGIFPPFLPGAAHGRSRAGTRRVAPYRFGHRMRQEGIGFFHRSDHDNISMIRPTSRRAVPIAARAVSAGTLASGPV